MRQALMRAWNADRSRLALQWWFPALVVGAGALTAFVGSMFFHDIQTSVPFGWGTGPIVWPAVLFWTVLLGFAVLFGIGMQAHGRESTSALTKLEDRSTELQTLIRTMPPKSFLVTFEDLFKVSFEVDSRAGDGEEGLKASIVVALGGIASLVRTFESRDDNPQYSISLMVFRPTGQIRPEDLAKHVIFAEPGYNPRTWDGVLQLRQEFAYRFDHETMQLDAESEPLMLPIPEASYRMDNGRPAILPGAPSVFCDPAKSVGFENTLELARWCRENSALRSSVADEIERYYATGPGKSIRSFLCMPVAVTPNGGAPVTIGVLTIQSSRPGFLPGEKAGQFVPLATPFVMLIGRSLAKYRVVPKAVPAAVPNKTAAIA